MNKYLAGIAVIAVIALGGMYQQYRISNLKSDLGVEERKNEKLNLKIKETLELNKTLVREAANKDLVIAKERSRADTAHRQYTEVTNDINKMAEEDADIAKVLSIELPDAVFNRLLVE